MAVDTTSNYHLNDEDEDWTDWGLYYPEDEEEDEEYPEDEIYEEEEYEGDKYSDEP